MLIIIILYIILYIISYIILYIILYIIFPFCSDPFAAVSPTKADDDIDSPSGGGSSSSSKGTPPPIPMRRSSTVAIPTILEEPAVASVGQYSYAELKTSLPPGVDGFKKEQYLSDDEFLSVFKMTKDTFSALPKWRQTTLKKDCHLH
jgi:hypothetical protein